MIGDCQKSDSHVSGGQMSVCQKSDSHVSVCQKSYSHVSICQKSYSNVSVGQMSVCQKSDSHVSAGQMSSGQILFDQKTWNQSKRFFYNKGSWRRGITMLSFRCPWRPPARRPRWGGWWRSFCWTRASSRARPTLPSGCWCRTNWGQCYKTFLSVINGFS